MREYFMGEIEEEKLIRRRDRLQPQAGIFSNALRVTYLPHQRTASHGAPRRHAEKMDPPLLLRPSTFRPSTLLIFLTARGLAQDQHTGCGVAIGKNGRARAFFQITSLEPELSQDQYLPLFSHRLLMKTQVYGLLQPNQTHFLGLNGQIQQLITMKD